MSTFLVITVIFSFIAVLYYAVAELTNIKV